MKRIVLTGASGYIGSKLLNYFSRQGYEIAVIARPESNVKLLDNNIKLFRHQVNNIQALIDFITDFKPDCVLHLASCFLAAHSSEQVLDLINSNVLFSTQLLEAMTKAGVKKFINTGTVWQHYNNELNNPVNLYAATKQAFYEIINYYTQAHDFAVISLELYDTYGPDDPRKKLFYWLKHYSNAAEALKMSPGQQKMHLVYIDDIINAYELSINLLSNLQPHQHQIYCLPSQQALSLKQVVSLYEQVAGVKVNIEWGGRAYRPREVLTPWSAGDSLLGWSAEINLHDGLAFMLQ